MTHREHRLLGFAGEAQSEVPDTSDNSFEAQANATDRVDHVHNGITGTNVSIVAEHLQKMQGLEEAWNTAMATPIAELNSAIQAVDPANLREGVQRVNDVVQGIARVIEQMLKQRGGERADGLKVARLAREIALSDPSMMLVVEANNGRNGWSVTARLTQHRES